MNNHSIHTLFDLIQFQQKMIRWLLLFICKFIPLKQWTFDDAHSPKYQKFKTDQLPILIRYQQQWDYNDLILYFKKRYDYDVKPVKRRKDAPIHDDTICPRCSAPMPFLYKNNGKKGQLLCKVCSTLFSPVQSRFDKKYSLKCPHCGYTLSHIKDRKFFRIFKCIHNQCPYYLYNKKHIDKEDQNEPYGKSKYKLRYLYREFSVDFFRIDLSSIPKNASSLKFSKHNAHVMSLCLTMHVNLGLSLRKSAQALKDLYGIQISHQQVANYARTAALVIKPFVDHYDYNRSNTFTADETYIKVGGVKGFLWFIMDAASRSIIGYQLSDNRGVGPCILAMRMAFRHLKKLPQKFRFISDGYSAYPLAAQQFFLEFGEDFHFNITPVIGLTNDDQVSKEYRPFKQMAERLNRTFKASYRVSCGYHNYEGANYHIALWVAYYNFLRPHKQKGYQMLNQVDMLNQSDTMPGKWQLLIYLGQQTILHLEEQRRETTICS